MAGGGRARAPTAPPEQSLEPWPQGIAQRIQEGIVHCHHGVGKELWQLSGPASSVHTQKWQLSGDEEGSRDNHRSEWKWLL